MLSFRAGSFRQYDVRERRFLCVCPCGCVYRERWEVIFDFPSTTHFIYRLALGDSSSKRIFFASSSTSLKYYEPSSSVQGINCKRTWSLSVLKEPASKANGNPNYIIPLLRPQSFTMNNPSSTNDQACHPYHSQHLHIPKPTEPQSNPA